MAKIRKENERREVRSMKGGQKTEDEGEERKIPGHQKRLKILELRFRASMPLESF